jgi:Asp/Glu/hydantoin racemase
MQDSWSSTTRIIREIKKEEERLVYSLVISLFDDLLAG